MATVNRGSSLGFIGRIAVVALFLAGIVLSGKFADLWDGSALIFVIGGTTALTLLGFSFSEIGTAVRRITGRTQLEEDAFFLSHFWEALGRNFWIIGVLGSVISFVLNLVQGQGGIQDMSFRLASSFQPSAYGLILGVFCSLPAIRLSLEDSPLKHQDQTARSNPDRSEVASLFRIERGVGLLLMIAVVLGTTVLRLERNPTRNFPPLSFLLDWPAVLVVAGGAVVATVLLAPKVWGASITFVSALMGAVAAILGLLKVLLALSHANISNVAGSIAFIISSCFIALLIMILAGIPLSDRERCASPSLKAAPLLRLSWYVYPLIVLIFLVLAFILVITPFQKPA